MKKGTYVLIILLVFFLLMMATFASFFYFQFSRPPSIKAHSYLEIPLMGPIEDMPAPGLFANIFTGGAAISLHDVWRNIQKAKIDSRIKALVLKLGMMQCDWGKVNEIREAVLDFKSSGKSVYAYFDEAMDMDKEYYLATACDKIIMHPLGSLFINGIGGDVPFLKKTFDKLGIEAEVEHVEEFKTAYHMFTEEGFTPAHKEMMESIYGDIYTHYVRTLAKTRDKTEAEIRELIDRGFFQGQKAIDAGLVDELFYEDELIDHIRGDRSKITKIPHKAYVKIKPSSVGLDKGRKIALSNRS